jgi:hypothetical protein
MSGNESKVVMTGFEDDINRGAFVAGPVGPGPRRAREQAQ